MCWEQCAAVMQTHSAGYFAAAVRQLPPAARITLCNVLQVPTQPVSIRIQSDRITQVVSAALCGAAATQAGGGPGAAAAPVAAGVQRLPPAGGVGRIRSSGPGSGGSGTRKVRRSHQRRGAQDWQSVGELLSAEQSRRGAGATACRCRGSGGGRSDGAVAAACGGSGDISPGFRRGSGGGSSRGWTSEACRAEGPERPPVGSGGSAAGGGSY